MENFSIYFNLAIIWWQNAIRSFWKKFLLGIFGEIFMAFLLELELRCCYGRYKFSSIFSIFLSLKYTVHKMTFSLINLTDFKNSNFKKFNGF